MKIKFKNLILVLLFSVLLRQCYFKFHLFCNNYRNSSSNILFIVLFHIMLYYQPLLATDHKQFKENLSTEKLLERGGGVATINTRSSGWSSLSTYLFGFCRRIFVRHNSCHLLFKACISFKDLCIYQYISM